MAFVFQDNPTATIKARSATSQDTFTINGVASTITSADDAAEQINKILDIGGKEIAADSYMSLNISKGAVNNE